MDTVLGRNTTVPYLIGLGAIAILASLSQMAMQVTFEMHREQLQSVRAMDRQIGLIRENRRAALRVQLSQGQREMRSSVEQLDAASAALQERHRSLVSSSLDIPAPRSPDYVREISQAVRGARTETRLRRLVRNPGFAATLGDLIDALAVYERALQSHLRFAETELAQPSAMSRNEFILYVLLMGILVFEALYVFRPSVRRLEEALRTRSRFLSGMSHELRNPLNSIIGMANLLADTDVSSQQRAYLKILRNSSSGLLQLLNRLLDHGSLESGKLTIEIKDFEAESVIHSVSDLAVVPANANGNEFILDLDPRLPARWRTDPERLLQVLTNLVGNAAKFTSQGEIVLRVIREERDQTIFARFEVRDTGSGIEPDRLEAIFQPFVQENDSIRQTHGGTGLGLAISREILTKLGSTLQVKSEKGVGSVFSFALKIDTTQEEDRFEALVQKATAGLKRLQYYGSRSAVRQALRQLFSVSAAKFEESDSLPDVERAVREGAPADSWVLLDFDSFETPIMDSLNLGGVAAGVIVMVRSTIETRKLERLVSSNRFRLLFKPFGPWQFRANERTEGFRAAPARKLSVLIVDDSRENQVIMQAYISPLARAVSFASNGREAVDRVRAQNFDLVVMDIQMPVLDGHGALREIRDWESREKRTPVPIIAVSAYSRQEADSNGFDGYLVKPVKARDVIELVGQVVGANVGTSESVAESERAAQIIQKLGPKYLTNRQKELPELRRAMETAEWKLLEHLAHRIKGNAGSYGFYDFGKMGGELEQAAQEGHTENASRLVRQMEDWVASKLSI